MIIRLFQANNNRLLVISLCVCVYTYVYVLIIIVYIPDYQYCCAGLHTVCNYAFSYSKDMC